MKVKLSEDTEEAEALFSLPHLCYKLNAGYLTSNKTETVIGLTSNMRLYLNDKLFSNECTSFLLS